MVSAVDTDQLSWVIYNNLNEIIADPARSAGDLENYTDLRNGFLNIPEFVDTVRVMAADAGADTGLIEEQISAAQTADLGRQAGFADHLWSGMQADRIPRLDDLTAGYHPRAEFSIRNLLELQQSDAEIPREEFFQNLVDLNPKFEIVEGHINDSDGVFWDHDLVAQVDAALNSDAAALDQLIEIAGDETRMDALVEAIATEQAHDSFDYALNAAAPTEPVEPADEPANTDAAPEEVVLAGLTPETEEAPAAEEAVAGTDFVWDDDAIMETYDALAASNPETIAQVSPVTQEAYAQVAEVLAIETELAQYNINPAAYIQNGNIPPSEEALESAQDAAYTHLAELNSADAQTVSIEASAVSEFNQEFDNAPLTPAEQGGQEYLADAGLNETGTNTLAAEASAAFAAAAAAEETVMEQDVAPENSFEWNDDAILSTYEDLRQANPETIAGTSEATQEAYSHVAEVVAIETEIAQYNVNPATYIQNGNIPPTQEALEIAENNAYEHLAGLDGETADLVSTEAAEVVASDAENGVTPLTPEQQGGQEYLADAGLNSTGTAYIEDSFETPTEENAPPSPPTVVEPFAGAVAEGAAVDSVYTVEAGDNLWNIAQEQYSLTNAGDIMRAVDHIARMNGLENGTDANHINIGDELDMPSAQQITQDVDSLDWNALDAETQRNLQSGGYGIPDRAAAAPQTLG